VTAIAAESDAPAAPYTVRAVQQMLGLPAGVIMRLIQAGFVTPTRGPRNAYRFSFHDVVLLRTAHQLRAARVPARRLLRALVSVRASLPRELPLTGLRISAIGHEVVVRDGGAPWAAESGQRLMDFEVAPVNGSVAFLQRPMDPKPDREPERDLFKLAEALEAEDRDAAEANYRELLAANPDHPAAALNLGAMLCEAGRCEEALALYDDAITRHADDPLLHFNRAIALEDRHRFDDAIASYARSIELVPDMSDAHYNVARLYERTGNTQKALRHYSAYRRLQNS
jgi:tetratricopeptide (TPR) repeat protein